MPIHVLEHHSDCNMDNDPVSYYNEDFDLRGLVWDLRVCISDKLSDDADPVGLRTIL